MLLKTFFCHSCSVITFLLLIKSTARYLVRVKNVWQNFCFCVQSRSRFSKVSTAPVVFRRELKSNTIEKNSRDMPQQNALWNALQWFSAQEYQTKLQPIQANNAGALIASSKELAENWLANRKYKLYKQERGFSGINTKQFLRKAWYHKINESALHFTKNQHITGTTRWGRDDGVAADG